MPDAWESMRKILDFAPALSGQSAFGRAGRFGGALRRKPLLDLPPAPQRTERPDRVLGEGIGRDAQPVRRRHCLAQADVAHETGHDRLCSAGPRPPCFCAAAAAPNASTTATGLTSTCGTSTARTPSQLGSASAASIAMRYPRSSAPPSRSTGPPNCASAATDGPDGGLRFRRHPRKAQPGGFERIGGKRRRPARVGDDGDPVARGAAAGRRTPARRRRGPGCFRPPARRPACTPLGRERAPRPARPCETRSLPGRCPFVPS